MRMRPVGQALGGHYSHTPPPSKTASGPAWRAVRGECSLACSLACSLTLPWQKSSKPTYATPPQSKARARIENHGLSRSPAGVVASLWQLGHHIGKLP